MRQDEAIRREHETLEEIARLGQEIDAIKILIYRFGQARRDWHNPEMVKRLSRALQRLEAEQETQRQQRQFYAQFI